MRQVTPMTNPRLLNLMRAHEFVKDVLQDVPLTAHVGASL